VVDRAALRRQTRSRVAASAGQRADDADEKVGMTKTEKRRFQFDKRLGKSFEPITCGTSLGRQEQPFKGRVGIYVAGPGVDIAYREATLPRLDPDRQPVAVLIVNHLMRLRRADAHGHRGEERHTSLATRYPRHLLLPP
jgi:hypothetical protein